MFHFITFHLRRMRESKANNSGPNAAAAAKARKSQQEKAKARWVEGLSTPIVLALVEIGWLC